jgi:hypothetical protein
MAARAILTHIRHGRLAEIFTARDVYQHHWFGLTNRDQTLENLGWIRQTGGRPSVEYQLNPMADLKHEK